MSSLYDLFKEIYEDNSKWDYYEVFTHNKPDFEELFTNPDEAKSFILNYIKNGSKDYSVLLKDIYTNFLSDNKAIHTISIFFLGLCLYENCSIIKSSIDSKIKELYSRCNCGEDRVYNVEIKFSYYWVLICFFHDIAYFIEDNYENYKGHNVINSLFSSSSDRPIFKDSVPLLYRDVWENYYKFRLSIGKIDHGILGGFLFYNDMKKKYYEIKEKVNPEIEPFEYKRVLWSKEILEEVHGYVAWIIIAHNIWFIKPDTNNCGEYRKFELDMLIDPNEKACVNKYPFFFLISLVDTIDPIKKISCQNKLEVLKSIFFNIYSNNFEINLPSISENSKLNFFKQIKITKDWIDVRISDNSLGDGIIINICQEDANV